MWGFMNLRIYGFRVKGFGDLRLQVVKDLKGYIGI